MADPKTEDSGLTMGCFSLALMITLMALGIWKIVDIICWLIP